jgi:predicted ferric reductase
MACRGRGAAVLSDEALWALGRGTGITALAFLTVSLAMGIATRSGRRLIALPRFAVADLHRFAALAGALLVVLHVALLFFDPYAQLRFIDFVVPFLGAYRPLWLGLGTLAFDVLVVVIVSSILRHRLGLHTFRALHWTTYALWPIALAHALGNGTDAGRQWFLGFAGCCAITVTASLVWRFRSSYAEYSDTRSSGMS